LKRSGRLPKRVQPRGRRRSSYPAKLRRPQSPRPSLPAHPPAPARSEPGQVLRRRFRGTKTSSAKASREQVEGFVAHLADWAEKDRNALLCQLNSYPQTKEGAA
jgi:hypothetical protein